MRNEGTVGGSGGNRGLSTSHDRSQASDHAPLKMTEGGIRVVNTASGREKEELANDQGPTTNDDKTDD
jgi:hypothetical protein